MHCKNLAIRKDKYAWIFYLFYSVNSATVTTRAGFENSALVRMNSECKVLNSEFTRNMYIEIFKLNALFIKKWQITNSEVRLAIQKKKNVNENKQKKKKKKKK